MTDVFHIVIRVAADDEYEENGVRTISYSVSSLSTLQQPRNIEKDDWKLPGYSFGHR